MSIRPVVRFALAAALGAALVAPLTGGAQQVDAEYSRLIKEYTSDPRFLPASLATIPASSTVPSPQKHFGTIAGAPGVMHHAGEVYGYFRALAKATPRVRFEKIGTTEEGRDLMLAVITDDATMPRLEEHRAKMARLADPRTLQPNDVESLIATTKPIYYFNAGLHSPEMGSPEMVMELAYRLAASDEPSIKKIRDNVIVLINPVSEPDGRDRQVDWYLRYTKGRPSIEDGFPRTVPYWGKYVVHDNNRDGLQISQALTKAIFDTYYKWHPLVMHDLHESVPLLYISTGTGPYNDTNDPIAISEWQLLANHDVTALSAQGMPGVWTWGFFDGWWPGYAMWVANNHNSIGRFYETFGNAGADTYVRDLSNQRFANELVTSRQWYRAWPPTKKVRWSARDNVNYMQAGVLASLGFTADNGTMLLRNFHQKGTNSLARGASQKPYAYHIPGFDRQRDPKRTAYLVNQLRRHGLEVHRVTAGDSTGDYVVQLNQPYRDLAVNLLSKQNFPSTALYPPYDDIAWTLSHIYGVEVKAVDDIAIQTRGGLTLLADTVAATARVAGSGTVHLLAYKAQGELLPALHWLKARAPNAKAWAVESKFVAGRDSFPVGSVIFEGLDAPTARDLAGRFALPLAATASAPAVARHALDVARIAIFHTWHDTQNEGWSRYTFEQYGVPYTSIDKDDVRRGKLRQRFDVILIPEVRGDIQTMLHEVDRKWGPLPFQKSAQTPSFGTPAASADITGGMGFDGLAELNRFVEDGGALVTLGNASRYAVETGMARELSVLPTRTLFHPGSIVRARARSAASPLLYGFPETFTIFRGNGPLFQVPSRDSAFIVMQFGTTRPPVPADEGEMMGIPSTTESKMRQAAAAVVTQGAARAPTAASATAVPNAAGPSAPRAESGDNAYVVSGMVRAQEEIVGQGALFDVPVRNGRVVAFAFDPLHRFLNHHDFPLVWNAILNWNDRPTIVAPALPKTAGQ